MNKKIIDFCFKLTYNLKKGKEYIIKVIAIVVAISLIIAGLVIMFSAKTAIKLPGDVRFAVRGRTYKCSAYVLIKGRNKNHYKPFVEQKAQEVKSIIKKVLKNLSRYRFRSRSYRQRVFNSYNLPNKINALFNKVKIVKVRLENIKRVYIENSGNKTDSSNKSKTITPENQDNHEMQKSLGG